MQKEVIKGDFNLNGELACLPVGKYEITIYDYDNQELNIHERRIRVTNLDPTLQMLHKQYGI